ncbi:FAD binding domain protein, partial [Vibrio parahaemolyticus AQ3810]
MKTEHKQVVVVGAG